jgi:hypothetical protein
MSVTSSNGTSGSRDPQKLARIAGWFFVITFLTSIPAVLLYDPVLHQANYILGTGANTRVYLGALLEIGLIIANIGTAVALFPIIKRHSESISLGYVASRTVESTIIAIGIVSLLSVVTLRKHFAGTGVDATSLTIVGRSLVAIHDRTFLLGPAFCAAFGNGILLGSLMYRSELVPRRMALLGVIGGPLAFVSATAVLFGAYGQSSGTSFVLTLPEILWEASLGIYLIVKGFRPQARVLGGTQPPVVDPQRLAPVAATP